MALIKCPECGKEVSSSAPTCPHCGYQLKKNTQTSHKYPPKRSDRIIEKEHDRQYISFIVAGVMLLVFSFIVVIVLLFFLLGEHPAIKISGESLRGMIGLVIFFVVSGILLIAIGTHRLND